MRRDRSGRQAGFTLVELVAVIGMAMAVAAIGAPQISTFMRMQRAATGARQVERELQNARLKSVSASRTLRVRFNCPTIGSFRILEFTGVPATDDAPNRCNPTAFPSPGPNDSLRSTPSLDSPTLTLPKGTLVTGAAAQVEFNPQGVAFAVSATGAVTAIAGDLTMTVTRTGFSKTVTINGLGRIKLN